MRTCKYTIRINDALPVSAHLSHFDHTRSQWHEFSATCTALATDGFEYAVAVSRVADQITLTITGTAGRAKRDAKTNGLAVLEARQPVRSQFTAETFYGDDEVAA